MYYIHPNRHVCTFVSGKVRLLILIEAKRQTLPEINVYTRLFGSIEYLLVFFLDSEIKSIGVCAGSGASVLAGCQADLWITGEMSHHEVLDAVHAGTSVILCEHSNTERGYLKLFAKKLTGMLDNHVEVVVSEKDTDPLKIM